MKNALKIIRYDLKFTKKEFIPQNCTFNGKSCLLMTEKKTTNSSFFTKGRKKITLFYIISS